MRMPLGRAQDFGDGADRVLKRAHDFDAFGDRVHPLGIKRKPVEKGSGHARGPRFRDVLGIGRQNGGRLGADGGCHQLQSPVFLLGGGKREDPGRRAGAASDLVHGGGDIAGALDAFERRGHFRQKTLEKPWKPLSERTFLPRRGSPGEISPDCGSAPAPWGSWG